MAKLQIKASKISKFSIKTVVDGGGGFKSHYMSYAPTAYAKVGCGLKCGLKYGPALMLDISFGASKFYGWKKTK